MAAASDELRFEYAARLRDEIRELRREMKLAYAQWQRALRLAMMAPHLVPVPVDRQGGRR